MKNIFGPMTARIDAMSLRERFLLFICVIGVLGAITDALFISPLLKQQKTLVALLDKKSTQMDIQREETALEMLRRGRDRATELNIDIRKSQQDIDAVEQEINKASATPTGATSISATLKQILRRSERVSLVRVVQTGSEPGAALIAGPNARNVLEVTLSGGYADLIEYLSALEKALPQARWSTFWLRAESIPLQLTVRIIMPSGDL